MFSACFQGVGAGIGWGVGKLDGLPVPLSFWLPAWNCHRPLGRGSGQVGTGKHWDTLLLISHSDTFIGTSRTFCWAASRLRLVLPYRQLGRPTNTSSTANRPSSGSWSATKSRPIRKAASPTTLMTGRRKWASRAIFWTCC